MPDRNENIERLFAGFLGADEACEAARDVAEGLGLFSRHPAPEPDAQLLCRIKSQMSDEFARRQYSHRLWALRYASAVAAVIIVALATLFFVPDNPPRRIVDLGPFWGEGTAEGSTVSALASQVDELIDEMIKISQQEYDFEDLIPEIDQIEIEELEYVANSDDFWKG